MSAQNSVGMPRLVAGATRSSNLSIWKRRFLPVKYVG
jgi:hypothetical protein